MDKIYRVAAEDERLRVVAGKWPFNTWCRNNVMRLYANDPAR